MEWRNEFVEESYKEGEVLMTDILKKKLQKMEGAMYKFRREEITFPELIKRLNNIEEFYKDD